MPPVQPVKVSRKKQVQAANRILDLKEELLTGGGGIKPKTEVPSDLVPLYKKYASKYGLGPKGAAMLASIHKSESSFSRGETSVSSAGAQGPMQFMPETWAAYGKGNINNLENSVEAAANYLKASGAPNDWDSALFAYNRADWYVAQIKGDAEAFYGPPTPKQQQALELKVARNIRRGQAFGIYDKPRQNKKIPAIEGEGPGRGDWGGSQIILDRAAKPFADLISSQKRDTQNTASGGISDHWVGATSSYAVDISASGEEGDKIALQMHKRLGLVEPYETSWKNYTSKKYPGFTFQIGWKTDGDHFDHVHVGARNDGAENVTVGPMSIMDMAKAQRAPVATGSDTTGGGGGGSGATGGGGSGSATALGNTAWDNLQSFRVGMNPNQQVPLWGGGDAGGSLIDGGSATPMLAKSIASAMGQSKKPKLPSNRSKQAVPASTASTMGLPTLPKVKRKLK